MEYITVREAAQRWKISVRLTQQYCIDGRIQGAVKFGGAWAIPADARKPTDPRRVRREVGTAQSSPRPVPETEAAAGFYRAFGFSPAADGPAWEKFIGYDPEFLGA